MRNFVSPVNHIESNLSASTSERMIKRTKDLGLKYLSVTDSGLLSSTLKTYMIAKKEGIKTICGVEIYFKDDNCDIIKGTESEKSKYFQIVIHAIDQKAYQKLVKMISDDSKKTITLNDHNYPLFNWNDLKELSNENVTVVTSGLNCMISKHMVVNRPDLCLAYHSKLNEIFGVENVYLGLTLSKFNSYWSNLVEANIGGHNVKIPASYRVETDKGKMLNASDLSKGYHKTLEYIYINKIKYKVNKPINSAKLVADFVETDYDLQLKANKLLKLLSNKFGNKLLMSSYSFYAEKEDKIIQDMMLGEDKRYSQDLSMKSTEEAIPYLIEAGFDQDDIEALISNNEEWSERFKDFQLKYEYSLPHCDGDPYSRVMEIIKEKGRMKWDDQEWVDRLNHEIEVIRDNGVVNLLPYFLPIYDVLNHYQENQLVTGPSRGSAGGSLLMYLMGITQLNPLQYDLPFSRFLSIDRIQQGNLPDVDVDLPDRNLLVGDNKYSGYLYGKWGNKAAQISTRTLLRLKSSILDVNRFKNGEVEASVELLSKSLPSAPQGISDLDFVFGYENDEGSHVQGLIDTNKDLQDYASQKPDEWEIVKKCMGVSRQMGRHACAFAISDKPISDIIPTFSVGGVKNVIQTTAKEVEFAGLVKYDFLVVKALEDIGQTIKRINEKDEKQLKSGYFTHGDKELFIWDLPVDNGVYDQLCTGDTATIFQLNTTSMTPFVKAIQPRSIIDMATISALVRPGPLDFVDPETGRNMAEEYIERRFGNSSGKIEILNKLLPDTYAIIVYQEDLTKIGRLLGKLNPVDAENLRIFMSKKRKKDLAALKPKFMEGAVTVTDRETAEEIWNQMETFARYGFSIIHAVGYSMISYACAYLKHHYPLEWWASVLSNAEDKEIREVFFKHVKDIVAAPDINISKEDMVIDYNSKKIRSKLSMISGLGGSISKKIIESRPYTDIQDFVNKKPCGMGLTRKLVHIGVLDSLFKPGLDVEGKMQELEDAEQLRIFDEKMAQGKKVKELKKGKIDPTYIGLSPKMDFLIKKSVLPNMMLDLYSIMLKESKQKVIKDRVVPVILNDDMKRETMYISGEQLQKIDEMDVPRDMYFCCPGYVLEAKEFSYKKGTRKALKMIIDSSGYISEKVLWPDYETGELLYPKSLKKGCIANFFYSKKEGKPYTNIFDIKIDSFID